MTALFGKVPDSSEFVREGAYGESEASLEAALLALVEQGRLVEPTRFLSAAAGQVRVGAWIPSQDALGRAFPLALALPLPEQALLSIVPLHYQELLDAAMEALEARARGVRGLPYLTPPHPSLLVPRVHRARATLLHEPARRFQVRVLGSLNSELLAYALATILRAAELEQPLALALPDGREDGSFAWLEVLGALAPADVLSLHWTRDGARLGWGMELAALLACERQAWPLVCDDPDAREDARAYVGEDVWRAIERDCAMGLVLELLARAARSDHAR